MKSLRSALLSLWLLLLAVLLWPASLAAQSTGKLEGAVTDQTSGVPLAGCQVTVEGTTLGNITNEQGRFFILNVSPGLRSVRFNFTGYTPALVKDVLVQAGHTVTVAVALETTVYELEALVIEGEAEPLVPRDNVQSKQRLAADFSANTPVDRLEDALALKAGVVQDEAGRFSIRGSRLGSEAVYIDGILVRAFSEQSYLSEKISADNSPLVVGKNAVEEVSVITGGFNAEYGQAQSGVINIISREGGGRLAGSLQLISDGLMPRGSDYGYNELSAELGGALPLPGQAGFFLSTELKGMADASPVAAGGNAFRGVDQRFLGRLNGYLEQLGLYDPASAAARRVGVLDANHLEPGIQPLDAYSFAAIAWRDGDGDGLPDQRVLTPGDRFTAAGRALDPAGVWSGPNPARLPGNSGDLASASGKLTWYLSPALKLMGSYLGSRNQRVYYEHENLFNAPERRGSGERQRTGNAILGLDWVLHQDAEHAGNLLLRASRYRNRQHGGALASGGGARDTWGGFGLSNLAFIAEGRTGLDDIFQATEGYEPAGNLYPVYNSGYLNPFAATFTPLPGQRGQDHPASPLLLFNQSGLPARLVNDLEERLTVKADYDAQLGLLSRIKAGVDLQRMSADTRHLFYVGGPLQDGWSAEPRIYAAYGQHRLDLGDLVLDTGLRVDWFDPAAEFPSVPGEALPGDPRYRAERQLTFSPRVEVGFPVTDRSQLRLSYGVFAQVPAFSDYYSLIGRDIQQDLASDNINNYFGNGRLELPSTTSFEAGLTMLLSEDLYLDLVGYNRQMRGGIAYHWLDPAQLLELSGAAGREATRFGKNLFIATNGDQGSAQGFDFSLRRRFAGWWSADAGYSLAFARSSASDPLEYARAYGRQVIRDALTGRDKNPLPPSGQSPTDTDQHHTLNLRLSLEVPSNLELEGLSGLLLRRLSAHLTWHYHSGRPYTVVDQQGYLATNENNNARTAGVRLANLRVTKRFGLGGPERDRGLALFVEVMNLLNTVNLRPSLVNPTTGQPGVDAYPAGRAGPAAFLLHHPAGSGECRAGGA